MQRRRPPPHVRQKLDLGFRVTGQSVEIFEIRPAWRGSADEKHESAVAKATYVRTHGGMGERILDAVSISQRPAEAADRAVPGHWEGDLVEGSRGTYIATLVERRSRCVILVKIPEKRTEVVVNASIKAVRKLPAALRKSLTWDRGSELASHARFTVATDIKVYFCDPHSPWQRAPMKATTAGFQFP